MLSTLKFERLNNKEIVIHVLAHEGKLYTSNGSKYKITGNVKNGKLTSIDIQGPQVVVRHDIVMDTKLPKEHDVTTNQQIIQRVINAIPYKLHYLLTREVMDTNEASGRGIGNLMYFMFAGDHKQWVFARPSLKLGQHGPNSGSDIDAVLVRGPLSMCGRAKIDDVRIVKGNDGSVLLVSSTMHQYLFRKTVTTADDLELALREMVNEYIELGHYDEDAKDVEDEASEMAAFVSYNGLSPEEALHVVKETMRDSAALDATIAMVHDLMDIVPTIDDTILPEKTKEEKESEIANAFKKGRGEAPSYDVQRNAIGPVDGIGDLVHLPGGVVGILSCNTVVAATVVDGEAVYVLQGIYGRPENVITISLGHVMDSALRFSSTPTFGQWT